MRNHDIERLKQAAARYKADAFSLSDVEELTDFAIDILAEPSGDGVRRLNNGDGTETWYGLPVVVRNGLIPEGEQPIEVRSLSLGLTGRRIDLSGSAHSGNVKGNAALPGEMRIVLADKPEPITWTPPASLPDGEWEWDGTLLLTIPSKWAFIEDMRSSIYADWTDPPRNGRYRKSGNVATWIGEA